MGSEVVHCLDPTSARHDEIYHEHVGIPVFCDGQRFDSVTRLTHIKTISMCKSRRRKVQIPG